MNPSTAVLVSGTGRHLRNLLELERSGKLSSRIDLVIASKPGIPALDHAAAFGVPSRVLPPGEINTVLAEAGIAWVVLAGYLKRWPLPASFQGRAINIHPALLPLFGGKGFYGKRVHRAALASGMRVSGCTVHFVSDDYDRGPIIAQKAVEISWDDTPDTLAARVFAAELELLPAALNAVLDGRLRQRGDRVISEKEGDEAN